MSRRLRAEWSELHGSLLGLILEKLDLVDHGRFASVCSSWRSVAVDNPPINKPLYFALSHDSDHLVRRFITSFIPSWTKAAFVGASDGWLAIVVIIDGPNLFLLNKGLNSVITLPPPPIHPTKFLQCKVALSSPPSSCCGECTVVLKRQHDALFYCRLGLDTFFTKILDISSNNIFDILFDKGLLYVLCNNNTIVIFDHLLNKVTQLDTHLDTHFDDFTNRKIIITRLLVSENKLLMINDLCDPVTVFEFERNKSSFVRVNSINDNPMLVINRYCSVSITSDDHKEFRRNSADCFWRKQYTHVVDMGKDPCEAKVGNPWPLFFSMFNHFGIENNVP